MPFPHSTSNHLRDLVAIGEVMAELAPVSGREWRAAPAGDVFNVLVGASRLGLQCSFISAVGADGFAPMILDALDRERVDRSSLVRDESRQNGIYAVECDTQGERSFHYWRRGSAAAGMMRLFDVESVVEMVAQHRFLLVSGVTLAIVEDRQRLLEIVRGVHDRTTVVLDTNYRPKLWSDAEEYRRWWEQLLPYGSILLPSWDDLAAIYGPDNIESTLLRWSENGSTVIVKRGAEGCAWVENGQLVILPPLQPERIIDTAGAGDAFNAGVLAGLARGASIEDACMLGQQQAVQVLGLRGAIGDL